MLRKRAERSLALCLAILCWLVSAPIGAQTAVQQTSAPQQKIEQLEIKLQVGELVLFARRTERQNTLSLTLGSFVTLVHTSQVTYQQPSSALTSFQLHITDTLSLVGQRAPNGELTLFPQGTLVLSRRAPIATLTFTNLNTITFQLTKPDDNISITVTYTQGSINSARPQGK